MARKDFEEYYAKIKDQYFNIVNTLEEFGKQTAEKAIDPQVISNLETILEPVKNSYLSLAYIEYLLNLPSNKKVQKRNNKQFQEALKKIDFSKQEKQVLQANNEHITEAKKVMEEELN